MTAELDRLYDAAARLGEWPRADPNDTEWLCAKAEFSDALEAFEAAPFFKESMVPCPACGGTDPGAQVCARCRKLSAACTCMDREAIKAGQCARIPCPSPLHPRED